MFNLETAIAEWRRQMRAAEIKTPVPLEELEGHLREEIDRQMKAGTDSKQAFEAAVQKIGPASALQSEFKKVDAAKKERDRALDNKKAIFILANLALLLGYSLVLLKRESISQMTSGQRISCLAAVTAFTLFVWSGRLGYRFVPVNRKRTLEVILGLGGVFTIFWWLVFIYFILPRCDFTLGPLLVAIYWALFTPAGVLIGLASGIETAARKNTAMAAS